MIVQTINEKFLQLVANRSLLAFDDHKKQFDCDFGIIYATNQHYKHYFPYPDTYAIGITEHRGDGKITVGWVEFRSKADFDSFF